MTRALPFVTTQIVTSLVTAGAILVCDGPAARSEATTTEQKAALHTRTSSSGESTWEKARRVRSAIKGGDYSTAEKIAADVLANSRLQNWRFHPFSEFITVVAHGNDRVLQTQLDSWVAQNRKKPIPLLIRAQYHHEMAWFVRGGGFVHQIQAANLASHLDYLKKALEDVNAAIDLDSGNPHGFRLRLAVLRGLGAPGEADAAFERAIAKFPGYYPLYDTALTTLRPEWGGSIPAMYAFVDTHAGRAADDSPLKLLYLSFYRHLLGHASTSCSEHRNDKDKRAECTGAAMQQLVSPALEASVLGALQLYDRSDKYQFGIAIEGLFTDMLRTSGGDRYASVVLELAARSMHSDTQLKKEQPGPNDYMVDKLVAASWYWKGFYDNAIAKNEQALKGIEALAFPSQSEKDIAIAEIYRSLARTYSQQNRHPEVIAYGKAALALGAATDEEHLICWAHYRLKAYDQAVAECTRAIDNNTDNMRAYYWRGKAYADVGKKDDALRDLLVVANSQDGGFRASAAIAASMIYFERKDIRGALDLLNRSTHLYDPELSSRSNVATGYNNRCYAHMQLGDLKKALDDCNASLKYGNIPDAVRKRLELIERLKARETSL